MAKTLATLAFAVSVGLAPLDVRAESSPEARAAVMEDWTAHSATVERDVSAGLPLVVQVIVPLCSNEQINCGNQRAGQPGDLDQNLYWGAIFGARTHFERKRSPYTLLEVQHPEGLLERRVYHQWINGSAWGKGRVEVVVVLDAAHGDAIDRAVDRFTQHVIHGSRVTWQDGGTVRSANAHVIGYAGHNRLMDGKRLVFPVITDQAALPSFVLACHSQAYFSDALIAHGSMPLLTTKALMAPEGYAIDGVIEALAHRRDLAGLRRATALAYATWQRIDLSVALPMFAEPTTGP